MSDVFIAGGFKSSLLDNIVINGKTLGEWHAIDEYNTCVFIHCGQIGQTNMLNISIDSNSESYKLLKPLFDEGNGITLEIKSGIKFPSGVKTSETYQYVLKDGVLMLEKETHVSVYYDGKAVANDDIVKSYAAASVNSVCVEGTTEYTVEMTQSGDVATFVVSYADTTITFYVEYSTTDMAPIDKQVTMQDDSTSLLGCKSVVSGGIVSGALLLAVGAATLIRRKRDEEI
jgi:hypothetical protein